MINIQSNLRKSILSCFWSKNDHSHKQTIYDLLNDLSLTKKEVINEILWFKELNNQLTNVNNSIKQTSELFDQKRKRIIYLFFKDLTNGKIEEILSNKANRDHNRYNRHVGKVYYITKLIGWISLIVMNFGMLFYIYLFAINQSSSLQSAWFTSFIIWLIFEIFISSTGLVLILHIIIPLCILTDLNKIKLKVIHELHSYREKYNQQNRSKLNNIKFNAAKYFFISYQVASQFPELTESKLLLEFTSPWPKKKYGEIEMQVADYYEQTILLSHIGRIFLYFICYLFQYHQLIQDIIIQFMLNSSFGLFIYFIFQLYQIQSFLPIFPIIFIIFIIYFIIKFFNHTHQLELLNENKIITSPNSPNIINVHDNDFNCNNNSLEFESKEKKQLIPERSKNSNDFKSNNESNENKDDIVHYFDVSDEQDSSQLKNDQSY